MNRRRPKCRNCGKDLANDPNYFGAPASFGVHRRCSGAIRRDHEQAVFIARRELARVKRFSQGQKKGAK